MINFYRYYFKEVSYFKLFITQFVASFFNSSTFYSTVSFASSTLSFASSFTSSALS